MMYSKPLKVLSIFGTRPEALKMVSVIKELELRKEVDSIICVTEQHKEMLRQVLDIFDIHPDYNLNIMKNNQNINGLTTKILKKIKEILREAKPDIVLTHGDTTTTLAASLASFYEKIPVCHVEAGLRTYNNHAPWPEEVNRRVTDIVSDVFFAPTQQSRHNLLKEGVCDTKILVTGNTIIDTLFLALKKIKENKETLSQIGETFPFLDPTKRLILVTGHRRENFGDGIKNLCNALLTIANRDDVQIVFPVHLNPNVHKPVKKMLSSKKNIFLIDVQPYLPFVYLMDRSYFIITDSGGIQEEAPSLGKPVLVTRSVTERPEAVESGTVQLVSNCSEKICEATYALLNNQELYNHMSCQKNPYGEGTAARQIADYIITLSQREEERKNVWSTEYV